MCLILASAGKQVEAYLKNRIEYKLALSLFPWGRYTGDRGHVHRHFLLSETNLSGAV
jgi:hypothetical protein